MAQGLLTDRYLKGIPEDSRAFKPHGFLKQESITPELLVKIKALNAIALKRGQSLAQMSIAWLLKDSRITSVLIGASSVKQLENNVEAINNLKFEEQEIQQIAALIN